MKTEKDVSVEKITEDSSYFTISEAIDLIKREGFEVTAQQLRKYENAGLITPFKKTESKYRLYNDKNIDRLRLILALRLINLPLKKIKKYLILNERFEAFVKDHGLRIEKPIKKFLDSRNNTTISGKQDLGLYFDDEKANLNNESDRSKLRKVLLDIEEFQNIIDECQAKWSKIEDISVRFRDSFDGIKIDAMRMSSGITNALHFKE
jgi:DNA-binding transcriptional MerR regulator